MLSTFNSSGTRRFAKCRRRIIKKLDITPGPGSYKLISDFEYYGDRTDDRTRNKAKIKSLKTIL